MPHTRAQRAIVARDGPHLECRSGIVADHERGLAVLAEVLGEDEFHRVADPLGEREARDRIGVVLEQQAGIFAELVAHHVAAIEAHAVETHLPARDAQQVARQQRQRIAARDRPAEERRGNLFVGAAVLRLQFVGEPFGRALQRERDGALPGQSSLGLQVEVRFDARQVGERDRPARQREGTSRRVEGAALAERGPAAEAGLRIGAHQPHLRAGVEATIVVVDANVLVCRDGDVQPHGVDERRGRLHPGCRGGAGQCRQADGVGVAATPDVHVAAGTQVVHIATHGTEGELRVHFTPQPHRILDAKSPGDDRQLAVLQATAGDPRLARDADLATIGLAAQILEGDAVAGQANRATDAGRHQPRRLHPELCPAQGDRAGKIRRAGRASDVHRHIREAVDRYIRQHRRQHPHDRHAAQVQVEGRLGWQQVDIAFQIEPRRHRLPRDIIHGQDAARQ